MTGVLKERGNLDVENDVLKEFDMKTYTQKEHHGKIAIMLS
jgi:hypothetical protein